MKITPLENQDNLYSYDMGDIGYTVKRHDGAYYFLSYHERGEEKAFTAFPYDDVSFFAIIKNVTRGRFWTPGISVLVNDRMEQLDWNVIRETMTAELLAQHPIWCVVANFMRERPYGPEGQIIVKGGTKHFAPGARVYCYPYTGRGDGCATVKILARHRGSQRFITFYTNTSWLENWQVKLVYIPGVIAKLIEYWDWTPEARLLAEELAEAAKAHARPLPGQIP